MIPWITEPTATRFSDIRDTSLAKLVHDEVLGQILRGTLVPGQRINEPDVAQRLQVSRVPVREALRALESSGLVVSRKHAGVFVYELTDAEVLDLYQFRSLLDGFAGRCAAQLPTKTRSPLLHKLEQSIGAMQSAAHALDVQAYYRENLHFHWTLVEAAGNQAVSDSYRGIVQKLHLSRLKNLAQDVGMQASIQEHVRIVAALAAGDSAVCELLMAEHVRTAHRRLSAMIQTTTSNETTP